MDLDGACCLVVGGGRKVGRALALQLAAHGCHVAVTYRTAVDEAREVARQIVAGGRRGAAVPMDVSARLDATHAVAAASEALGGLDAVVYAASGPFVPMPPQAIDEDLWNASFDVLARGLFFVAQAARDHFIGSEPRAGAGKERGTIVALTDVGAEIPWASFAGHCSAKAAQLMLVRVLAKAWAAEGIRVCGVAPGPMDVEDDPRREASLRAAARSPSGRLVQLSELFSGVRECLENPGLTGINLVVDAGFSLA